jgi:peptidoglycan/xylan/chitin deacetylase (PgdA/CDA1 family)
MNPWITQLLSYTGIPSLSRRLWAQKGRFVLVFHGISSRRHAQIPLGVQPYLSKGDLETILIWVKKRFPFLTPEDFFSTNRPGVLLTFDDGLANNFTNARPVLEAFSAPAIFFIPVQHIGNPQDWLSFLRETARSHWQSEENVPDELATDFYNGMSTTQVQECARHPLITIGSHTLTHPFLTRCTPAALDQEVCESKRYLESITGCAIDLFAYPSGDYNSTVAKAVQRAGYRAAFVLDSLRVGMPSFEIPRIGLYEAGVAYLNLKLSGLHRPPWTGARIQ